MTYLKKFIRETEGSAHLTLVPTFIAIAAILITGGIVAFIEYGWLGLTIYVCTPILMTVALYVARWIANKIRQGRRGEK